MFVNIIGLGEFKMTTNFLGFLELVFWVAKRAVILSLIIMRRFGTVIFQAFVGLTSNRNRKSSNLFLKREIVCDVVKSSTVVEVFRGLVAIDIIMY
jgi:hypothetical protein